MLTPLCLRSPRFLFVLAVGLAATLPPIHAQPLASPAQPESVQLETFKVTGSHLQRFDQEKVLPVSVVDRDFIAARNPSTIVDLLTALPQVVGLPLNEAAVAGADARGDNAAVSLRGLSSGDTLVLLNGRRVVPHPISPTEALVPALSVNVNQLPVKGLDRVEVLRDGASSIYGSDAIAGVINTIVRRDYHGAEFTAQYGVPERGGGLEKRLTGAAGRTFADGRGQWVGIFDYFDRAPIFARDRALTRDQDHRNRAPAPWNGSVPTNLNFFGRGSLGFFGNYTLGTAATPETFVAGRPAGIPASVATAGGTTFIVPTATGVGFKTTTPGRIGIERDYYINANAYRALQTSSVRLNFHNQFEWRFHDRLTGFGELGYYHADSKSYREPDSVSRTADGNIVVSADNPWNPFGARFYSPTGAPNADGTPRLTGTPAAVRIESKRFLDFGERVAEIDSRVFRLLGGLRGKVGETWEWEAAGLYSQADATDREHSTTRSSLFQNALLQTDPARAYNPFGYNFAIQNGVVVATTAHTNPRSVIDTFQEDFVRTGRTRLASGDIRAHTNNLFEFRRNRISLAVGGEVRYESFDDTRPPFAGLNPADSGLNPNDNDFLAVSPNPDTHAKRDLQAVYLEALVPLAGPSHNLPLVRSLEASLAVRHERYSDFGETTNPKFGLNWKPVSALMLRGSYNEGFRAPNLAQLFSGEFLRTNTTTDPYRVDVTGLPTDGAFSRLERRGGNRGLRPERSRGQSAGLVLDVPGIKGLAVSADYWTIETRDVIGVSGSVTDDRDKLLAETQRQLAAGVAIGSVDLTGAGDPAVVRLPVTADDRAAFAAYNSSRPTTQQRGVVGAIDFLRVTFFNKASQTLRGVDFDATYLTPPTRFGRFNLCTAWSHLLEFEEVATAGARPRSRRWLDGNAKWRGNASVTWRQRGWSAGLTARYIGSYQSSTATADAATYQALGAPGYISNVTDPDGKVYYRFIVDDSVMYNGYLAYRFERAGWLKDVSLRVAVNNLLDDEPPLSPNALGYDPSVYDDRGRTWFFEATKRF